MMPRDLAFNGDLLAYDIGRPGRNTQQVVRVRLDPDGEANQLEPTLVAFDKDTSGDGQEWSSKELKVTGCYKEELVVVFGELLPASHGLKDTDYEGDDKSSGVLKHFPKTGIVVRKLADGEMNLFLLLDKDGSGLCRIGALPSEADGRLFVYNEWCGDDVRASVAYSRSNNAANKERAPGPAYEACVALHQKLKAVFESPGHQNYLKDVLDAWNKFHRARQPIQLDESDEKAVKLVFDVDASFAQADATAAAHVFKKLYEPQGSQPVLQGSEFEVKDSETKIENTSNKIYQLARGIREFSPSGFQFPPVLHRDMIRIFCASYDSAIDTDASVREKNICQAYATSFYWKDESYGDSLTVAAFIYASSIRQTVLAALKQGVKDVLALSGPWMEAYQRLCPGLQSGDPSNVRVPCRENPYYLGFGQDLLISRHFSQTVTGFHMIFEPLAEAMKEVIDILDSLCQVGSEAADEEKGENVEEEPSGQEDGDSTEHDARSMNGNES